MRGPAYNESGSISWPRIGLTNRAAATYLFVRRKPLARYNLSGRLLRAPPPRLTSPVYSSAITQQKDPNRAIYQPRQESRVNSLSKRRCTHARLLRGPNFGAASSRCRRSSGLTCGARDSKRLCLRVYDGVFAQPQSTLRLDSILVRTCSA